MKAMKFVRELSIAALCLAVALVWVPLMGSVHLVCESVARKDAENNRTF